MAPPLIQLKEIRLTFGGSPLLTSVELSVSANERVCLIGRNGSGKSTLLKIAAGLVEPDGGSRFVQPGATIRYLPQEPDFGEHKTTLAYVEAGLGPGDDHYQARYLLEQLGLTGEEDPAQISGGGALAEEGREQHKLDRKIVDEEHWLRCGVSGRRKRNVNRLGNLHALRGQRRTDKGSTGSANLVASEAEKSGHLVIEAKNIEKSWDDRKVVDGFSIRVQRGDRIGIVGPNGAGKTTLVNLLTGAIEPDSGSIRH